MKKKMLSVVLSVALVTSMLIGCGSGESEKKSAETKTEDTKETKEEKTDGEAKSGGIKLPI